MLCWQGRLLKGAIKNATGVRDAAAFLANSVPAAAAASEMNDCRWPVVVKFILPDLKIFLLHFLKMILLTVLTSNESSYVSCF